MKTFWYVISAILTIILPIAIVAALSAFEAWILMLLVNWILRQMQVDFQLSFLMYWAISFVLGMLRPSVTINK